MGSGSLLVIQVACLLVTEEGVFLCEFALPLQRMENALAQEEEARSPVTHPLDELQLVDFSFYPSHKALQLSDLAGSHLLKPGVELFPGARTEHLSELLNQLICLIHLKMQRSKQSERFLVLDLQFFGATKQEKHCISCKHSGAWKLAVRGTLLPAFWKVTNQLPVDVAVGDDVTCGDQLPM